MRRATSETMSAVKPKTFWLTLSKAIVVVRLEGKEKMGKLSGRGSAEDWDVYLYSLFATVKRQ